MTLGHILMNIIIQGMVVLKEQIFNSFHFVGKLLFNRFLLWEGVMVLIKLILYSFYFGMV